MTAKPVVPASRLAGMSTSHMRLIAAVPYKIHALTDDGIQFTTRGATGSAVPLIKEAIDAHDAVSLICGGNQSLPISDTYRK
ncbi:hypothetical protein NXC12_PE00114 (plasmid) [Rhizobium etli]|uniref:Uncharacterized protein n=1 Tax=Rhizobium etli TaxID=29449 RepID=A0AAN1BMG2_RHIET|nr:hypothetical protein [Rhizobium etli]ARQ13716.1 hypothetical protein NXC12_PE00114 [Rhizobium etli]